MAGLRAISIAGGRPVADDDPLPVSLDSIGVERVAKQLALVAVAGSVTLGKAKWPGAYTVTLPSAESGDVASMTEAGAVVGGVFAPKKQWGGVLLDLAGAGAADQTTIVEIGKLTADACMPQVLASVSLKSITTGGTFTANFNPFTGAPISATTFRLYDLVAITLRGGLGQVLLNAGGLEDDSPAQLLLNLGEAPYYFVLVRTLGVAGPVTICITPQP